MGAGGARGLAHIGVVRALEESRIPVDGIVGVSFGSIVGALYSIFLDIDEVEKRLKAYVELPLFQETKNEIDSLADEQAKGFFDRMQASIKKGYFYAKALSRKSLVTPEDFVSNMRELVGDLTFADMQIPFKCLSVDLVTGEPIVFNDGDLLTALQASCASPGFFPPVKVHDMLLVDGGVAEMVPYYLAQTCKPDYTIGVDVTRNIDPIENPDDEIHHSLDVVFRSYDITRDFMNVYVDKAFDCVIRPPIGSYLWSDFEYFDTYVGEGYRATRSYLQKLRRDIFWLDL